MSVSYVKKKSARYDGAFSDGLSGLFFLTQLSDSGLGIYTKSHANRINKGFTHSEHRSHKFGLQQKAKNILRDKEIRGKSWAYKHRVCYCLSSPVSVEDDSPGIGVYYNVERGRANYSNLQRCGSIWTCPVCAAQITEHRREELQSGIDSWKEKGGSVYLVTFTNRHHFGDHLSELLAGQRKAFIKFWQKRKVVETMKSLGYVGRIVATEVTWSENNGWHPHYHMLFFFNNSINEKALRSFLAIHWQDVCLKAKMKAPDLKHGVDVRDGRFASKYVSKFGEDSKWGLAAEMVKGHTKKGRDISMTPFDLLRASEGDDIYAMLFSEFANVFKGKRQLFWTAGLKELLEIEVKSDQDIVEEVEKVSELITHIPFGIWDLIVQANARAHVLTLLESDYLSFSDSFTDFIYLLLNEWTDDTS